MIVLTIRRNVVKTFIYSYKITLYIRINNACTSFKCEELYKVVIVGKISVVAIRTIRTKISHSINI